MKTMWNKPQLPGYLFVNQLTNLIRVSALDTRTENPHWPHMIEWPASWFVEGKYRKFKTPQNHKNEIHSNKSHKQPSVGYVRVCWHVRWWWNGRGTKQLALLWGRWRGRDSEKLSEGKDSAIWVEGIWGNEFSRRCWWSQSQLQRQPFARALVTCQKRPTEVPKGEVTGTITFCTDRGGTSLRK
jgi:hypothetical protein